MGETGIQPVMNMGGNDGMGLNSFGGIIGLLAVLGMMGGGMFNWGGGPDRYGYQPQYATQTDLQNGFNFADLQDQNRDILTAINNGTSQTVATVNGTFHDTVNVVKDAQAALAGGLGDVRVLLMQLMQNQNECCCGIKQEIMQNRYENALNTASINANTTAVGQKILDVLAGNEIASLRQEVQELKNERNLVGVVRYPMSMGYNAGPSPFCSNAYAYQ